MALRRLDFRGFSGTGRELAAALPRPVDEQDRSAGEVAAIIAEVRAGGDAALRRLTRQFDGVAIDELRVPSDEIRPRSVAFPPSCRRRWTSPTTGSWPTTPTRRPTAAPRLRVGRHRRAASGASGGPGRLLRPRGAGPLSVDRADVRRPRPRWPAWTRSSCACRPGPTVESTTPPWPRRPSPASTRSTGSAGPRPSRPWPTAPSRSAAVDVIVGPGNRYVAEAKRQVSGAVGVASAFAGPSEVVVVAGPETPAELAAIDLVVQAEHGPDGLAWLITWSEAVAEPGRPPRSTRIVGASPRRAELEATLDAGGYAVLVDGPEQAWRWPTSSPPSTWRSSPRTPSRCCPWSRSAGAVFLGPWLAGQRRRLPGRPQPRAAHHPHGPVRQRAAGRRLPPAHPRRDRQPSRLSSVLGPHVVTLAETEGLPAHAESVRLRWPGSAGPGGARRCPRSAPIWSP